MVTVPVRAVSAALLAPLALVGVWALGCASADPLTPPRQLVSPYATTPAEPTWAVVPLRNETGTSAADAMAISDDLVAAITQTRGLRALPLNRSIDAMATLDMAEPEGPEDLERLARVLGVEGVVVGSVTAYDPYEPTLGLALALYARPGTLARAGEAEIDTRRLVEQPTDYDFFRRREASRRPASTVSLVLDGRDHGVRMATRAYARGRTEPGSALGWERYLKSMPEFQKFAVWTALDGLFAREWVRLASREGVPAG